MAKTIQDFKNSFHIENEIYHTDAMTHIKSETDFWMFYGAVFEMLADTNMLFAYDLTAENHRHAFLFYKVKGQLMVINLHEKSGNTFVINTSLMMWTYPHSKMLTHEEVFDFIDAFVDFTENTKIAPLLLLLFQNRQIKCENHKRRKKYKHLTPSQLVYLKILSLFFLAGMPLVLFSLAVLSTHTTQHVTIPYLILFIGFLLNGAYLMLGAVLKFRHIYCMLQWCSKIKMTPNHVNWNLHRKLDLYGIPMFYITIGGVGLLLLFL